MVVFWLLFSGGHNDVFFYFHLQYSQQYISIKFDPAHYEVWLDIGPRVRAAPPILGLEAEKLQNSDLPGFSGRGRGDQSCA